MSKPNKLLQNLIAKHGIQDHDRFGKCVVIPQYEWGDSTWKKNLEKAGTKVTKYGNVYYVTVPDAFLPKTAAKKGRRRIFWQDKEDKLLKEKAKDETLTDDQICEKYVEEIKGKPKWPQRTKSAILKHISVLREKGDIPYKRPRSGQVSAPTEEAADEESTSPAKQPAESPVKMVPLENMEKGVKKDEGFSAIVFDEEQLLMQLRRKDVEKWGPVLKAALGDSS
jgi:hypothetical protein